MVWYLAQHPRGVQPEALHLMGYSIGAHIAGLTSNYIEGAKLGRITGSLIFIFYYYLATTVSVISTKPVCKKIMAWRREGRSDPSFSLHYSLFTRGFVAIGGLTGEKEGGENG
jgi:hypothetical protein